MLSPEEIWMMQIQYVVNAKDIIAYLKFWAGIAMIIKSLVSIRHNSPRNVPTVNFTQYRLFWWQVYWKQINARYYLTIIYLEKREYIKINHPFY